MPFGRRRWRDSGFYPPPSKPRPVKDGLRAKSQRGAIGETWWSQRFIEVLEDFHEGPRLVRGRAYARRGQVIAMDVGTGEVTALVQGSRARPYSVSIGVTTLSDDDWGRVEEAMARRAVFLARLLAGEMPNEIEEAFTAAGLSLFPADADALRTDCSCPDWQNPCKHVAAVYYLLAEAFDGDPFLILAWRGRPRERLLADLRALRGKDVGAAGSGPMTEADAVSAQRPEDLFGLLGADDLDLTEALGDQAAGRFWNAGTDLGSLRVEPRMAAMPDAILRDLGPSGLSVGGRPLEDLLAPRYRAIAAAAVRMASGGPEDEVQPDPGPPTAPPVPVPPDPGPPPAPPVPVPPPGRKGPRANVGRARSPSQARLAQLIDEATVDCYNDSEECTGLFEMINEYLALPFTTTVLGVAVSVTGIDLTPDDRIVAVCRRGRDTLRLALLDLPMPGQHPAGAEWVDAYRLWARRR